MLLRNTWNLSNVQNVKRAMSLNILGVCIEECGMQVDAYLHELPDPVDEFFSWCKYFIVLQVQGVVQDRNGKTVATLFGRWDESMHYVGGDCLGKGKDALSEAHVLWRRSKPPKFPTRYNLTRFAITLNELTPGLKVLCYTWRHFLFCYFAFPSCHFISGALWKRDPHWEQLLLV